MQPAFESEDDFFLMSNLPSRKTGLPFVVWISPRDNARHDVRVKVSRGARVKPGEMVVVAIRPKVRVIHGILSRDDLKLLTRWVEQNRDALVRFWDGDIEYTDEILAALTPLEDEGE